jgi:hypothetical protein
MTRTRITIDGDSFLLNSRLTYESRSWQDRRVEGLLCNTRMVQGIFDDSNPETAPRWAYPDTGCWDADRNTAEFIAAMPEWRRHGVLGFTLNLQGGSPEGYSREQPWHNSAFAADGSLCIDYLARCRRILQRADELGMVVILGLFYFGQDERLADECAVVRGVDRVIDWLLQGGWRHVLVELNNECNVNRYEHEILQPHRVHELIQRVRQQSESQLLVGTSYGGGRVPDDSVIAVSDFALLHGNGVNDPDRIVEMVRQTRALPSWRPMPVLFNEDDHFDFEQPWNNLLAALSEYASWGFFDPGAPDYCDGYQSPPVNWGLSTPRKQAFFELSRRITGC